MKTSRFRERLAHWGLLVLVSIGTAVPVVIANGQPAAAACYPGTVLGRQCWRGYFTDGLDMWGTNVLPPIRNNQALPEGMIDSADSLINLLQGYYNSGNRQERTSAAFIYNTMLDKNAPGIGINVTPQDWDNLRASLRGLDQAGEISWYGKGGIDTPYNVSANKNSYYQTTNQDDAYYLAPKNESGIEIRDYNGNVIYKILRRCANPIGAPGKGGVPGPRHYSLTPRVDSVTPTQVEPGSLMNVTTSVDNTGQRSSDATQWEITQIDVNPGKQAPHENNAGPSPLAPCQSGGGAPAGDYFKDGNSTCKNVAKGNGIFAVGSPSPSLQPSALGINIGDLPVGTRVCFALSVQPLSDTDGRWNHSLPVCTVVGKKPTVQIWGNDLAVRGNVETSTTVKSVGGSTQVFGSWVEYGVFAVGTVNRFASGSGLNGQTNNNQSAWSKLTFANINSAGAPAYGKWASAANFPPMANVASYFAALPGAQALGAPSVDLGNPAISFATGSPPVVQNTGNITITGGNIPAGRSVVIRSSGTVTITGAITYTNATLTSILQIPQVVIIAQNINIQDSVPQIDAWLVANNTINTCYNFTGNLTSNKCNVPLEVNGPVVTGHLLLNRTAGSNTGAGSGDPAERFDLRPDAFLWARLESVGNGKAQTVYTTELPPRF